MLRILQSYITGTKTNKYKQVNLAMKQSRICKSTVRNKQEILQKTTKVKLNTFRYLREIYS